MPMSHRLIFLIAVAPSVVTSFTSPAVLRRTLLEKDNAQRLASSSSSNNDNDLFKWARSHGAKISENVQIQSTSYGGRGLFASTAIAANTELLRLPYELQLGVRQLAEGTDIELQTMARELPWQYILQQDLTFIPLSIALCAEQRKGDDSLFAPFLRELPTEFTNAVAPSESFNPMIAEDAPLDLNDLQTWAPLAARKVLSRRNGLLAIHENLSPASLPFQTHLCWAAANACSRSLVRKRIKELSDEQVALIGDFCASDHARFLPVIDLVNHGSLEAANVWVGHLDLSDGASDIVGLDFSTSLKSTRDIAAGEELLFDYGGEGQQKISNERLLLDFGFVLPDHTDTVALRLEEFVPAISALSASRMGMTEVSEEAKSELTSIITGLINLASSLQGAPLLFGEQPTVLTLALALVMTCRGHDDVERVLAPVRDAAGDASLLPQQIVDNSTSEQQEFAILTLTNAATMALEQRPSIDDAKGDSSFATMARDYSVMCREMLQKVAE